MKQVVLYMPVVHKGYIDFINKHKDAASILILGESFTKEHPTLRKEIRAISPHDAAKFVRNEDGTPPVVVVEKNDLMCSIELDWTTTIVLPKEDVSREVVEEFGLETLFDVQFDDVFLRWDRDWATQGKPVNYDGQITKNELEQRFAKVALDESTLSSDWWRQVGAVAVRDGKIITSGYNKHYPSEHSPYFNSDPRNSFKRGVRNDLSTALHAEAALVANMASSNDTLAGADVYVSTFPCPGCARLLAAVGVQRVLFSGGYSMLEGEEVLKAAGIEIVFVDMQNTLDTTTELIDETTVKETK